MNWHPDRPYGDDDVDPRELRSRMQGSFPDVPTYDGPTTAERYVDDMAAIRSILALRLDVPRDLGMGEIVSRYFVGHRVDDRDDEGKATRIIFMDGSCAKKNRRDRWVVN